MKLIEFLIQNGADPYAKNKRRLCPMDLAKKNELKEVMKQLIQKYQNVN